MLFDISRYSYRKKTVRDNDVTEGSKQKKTDDHWSLVY